jgi:hypothetical protein
VDEVHGSRPQESQEAILGNPTDDDNAGPSEVAQSRMFLLGCRSKMAVSAPVAEAGELERESVGPDTVSRGKSITMLDVY